MTIASEIQRLQWAKSDMKTSIENKWVSVPSDAKLDEYAWYIDQIQQWAGMFTWVRLFNNMVTGNDCTPATAGLVSREQNWNLYWLVATTTEPSSHNYYYYGIYTFRKVATWDIQYSMSENGTTQNSSYTYTTRDMKVYKSWNNVRAFVFSDRARSWDWRYWSYCYQFDWDISTWNISNSYLWTWNYGDYNPTSYWGDITWYTQITWSSRVSSAIGNEIDDDWYIYLVLA